MIFFGKFRQITETEHTIQFVCDDKKTLAKVDYCGMLCGGHVCCGGQERPEGETA